MRQTLDKIRNFFRNLQKKHIDFAVIKLSAFYVLVIMLISLTFSFTIFRLSSAELDRGLGRQSRAVMLLAPNGMIDLDQMRYDQIKESQHRLVVNLIYLNLSLLVLSLVASYFFARRTLKPIEEAMESQNRFTADASHELRTPLAAMRTEIEVSLRDEKSTLDDSKKLLQSNLEEITKLETLSGELLKLARSEKDNIKFENVELEEILIEAFQQVEKIADKKAITFENDLRPMEIKGDKSSLVELFVILLDNAIKYSENNSQIHLSIAKEANKALIKVKDEGAGIKASDLPYIFNRFYRADSSRNKEKIPGYGLGLSIAKQIVELHNGQILVASRAGKGTEFRVILPLE